MSENLVENYGWNAARGQQSSEYITPKILEILKKLRIKRVIDIGAGNGRLCSVLSDEGYDVVGSEYDRQGVEVASKSLPNISFYQYGVQDDPGSLLDKEQPFDVVVSTEVIEHLFSPHLLPIYAHKILKDNGYLIITTPYHGYIKNVAITALNKWDHHHNPQWHGGHIKFWSRSTLTQLLEENGFKVISFDGVGRLPYLWKSMVLTAVKI